MRVTSLPSARIAPDDWLERQCRQLHDVGCALTGTLEQVNQRCEAARAGQLGRRQPVTLEQLREVEGNCQSLRRLQRTIQEALYDTEQEIRELRERDLTPADLIVEAEYLIVRYRFLRRRNRVLVGLHDELPRAALQALHCLHRLRRLREGDREATLFYPPGCEFALAALEQLRDEGEAPP
ncbi:MAG: hypothetical protein FJX77_10995 [Armatimonadetes bacterium]|nr:hypothetical protein [Armatimonadota bacterium]